MQYGFVRFFRLKMHGRQYGFVRFFRLKKSPRQYGFVRFFRLKKTGREFTQGSRHFYAFQQDMCSDESSTVHVFVQHCFVRHPIIHCLSLLDCTYTVIYTTCAHHRPRHQQQITLYCQASYNSLFFPTTALYIHSTILPHTPKQSVLQSQN
jgi:hypothetical protein